MARNVCDSPCGKYSCTTNNGNQTSWNKRNNVQDTGKETKLWCTSCIEFHSAENVSQQNASFDTGFGTERILYRRPRLVRGWYLGKEPLEYRKPSTPYRFSFQINGKDVAERENDKVKSLKNKAIIYPESITVGICSLQTRPVKNERKTVAGLSSKTTRAELKGKDKTSTVQTVRALNTERVPMLNENAKKEVSTVTVNKAKFEIDSKNTDSLRLASRTQVRQKSSSAKGRKLRRQPRTDYFTEKREDGVELGNENYVYPTGKIPDCCVECFTFKESDYDIWSRTNKP